MRPSLRFATVLVSALFASAALAAPPKITRLSVRGLQTGGTTRIAVQGTDLLPEPKLLVADSLVGQKLVGTPRPNAVEFDVTLDKSIDAGVYHLRLATPAGITPPEIITVDHLPQHAAGAANAAPEKLPVAVHGLINGAQVQETKFEGKKGQAITVDVLAQRLGSKLRPVVTLADSTGRQIASGLPVSHLLGDTRLAVTLPADGVYTLSVHDLAYAGATPGHYRLSIGQFDYVDQVYPPVLDERVATPQLIAAGERSVKEIELIGRFGNSAVAKLDATKLGQAGGDDAEFGAMLLRSMEPHSEPVPWPAGSQPIGLRPRIESAFGLVEDRTLDSSRKVRLSDVPPSVSRHAVSGRLLKAGEEDAYHFAVKPGEKWRFEVLGTQIGSPIDASLELRGAKGARLAQNDDAPGTDPRTTVPDPKLEYTVVAGVNEVTAVVTDAYRRGGPEMIYRLTATRLDGPESPGVDFGLRIFEDTHLVPLGGSKVFRVEADRQGYEGPISVDIYNLPAGFKAESARIRIGATAALVEIRRTEPSPGLVSLSPPRPFVVNGTVVGGMVWHPVRTHKAVVATAPLRTLQPWLADSVVIAPATYAHEFGVDWEPAASKTSASDKSASDKQVPQSPALESPALLGKDRKLTVRFQRGPGAIGPIRLSLLTSQVPVLVNGQPNPMQVLRGPAATVDVPLDPAVKQAFDAHAAAEKALAALEAMPKPKPAKPGEPAKPDPKREADLKAARAKLDEAAKKLREAEAKLKPTFDYTLSIPADLATIPHDIVVKAELRSLDNQTTLAEAFTPIKRLAITSPVELALSAEAPTAKEAARDAVAVTIRGQVVRLEDFAGDVTVTLAGLPAGITAPRQVLKAKETAFNLEVVVPPTFKETKLDGLRVTASLVPDARRANVTTSLEKKLPAISLKVPPKIAAADKPETPAKPALPTAADLKAAALKPAETKPAAPKD